MLRQHSKSLAALLRLFDALLLVAAWPASLAVWRLATGRDAGPAVAEIPFAVAVVVLITWMGATSALGLYASQRRERLVVELGYVAKSIGAVALVGLVVGAVRPGPWLVPPSAAAAAVAAAFVLLAASRVALRRLARAVRRRGYNARYYAVVGSGAQAEALVEEVKAQPQWGYTFLGYIREPGAPAERGDAPVLGRLDELGRLLTEQVIDEVFFAVGHHQLERIEPAVQLCEEQGVLVRISLGAFGSRGSRLTIAESEGHPVMTLSSTPANDLALAAKRLLDVVVSAAMLVLISPILLAIAVAIRRDSPGPVLFRQRRVGLNGREFTFFKFRSMRVGAEAELAMLRAQNEMDGPVFKMQKDPRITGVGQFLRRTSLDELPQFWNVLRGEMSLVGPRPPLPAEVRQYLPWQRRRLSVKPGITCTWQVSGRNEIDFEHWMRLDLDYIDGWSFWGDVGICFQTIPAVLRARGAR